MNRKFVVLYITKDQYNLFEELIFKYSKADYKDVLILNVDSNSMPEQKKMGIETCERLGIVHLNTGDDPEGFDTTSAQSCLALADKYLSDNDIDANWIVHFQHDTVPFVNDFWDRLDDTLGRNKWMNDKVGSFGFCNYMRYNQGIKHIDGSPVPGRGNLIKNILNHPHNGWYKNLSADYYQQEYFVIESPNWQAIGFNRKLYRENIEVDVDFKLGLWPDDVSHQFMLKNIFNITFPDLPVCHDHGLKDGIKVITDPNYTRSNLSHEKFKSKYGWQWGYRNKLLREQFEQSRAWWVEDDIYIDTIQEKLFEMDINDGPKRIEDFE